MCRRLLFVVRHRELTCVCVFVVGLFYGFYCDKPLMTDVAVAAVAIVFLLHIQVIVVVDASQK